jgi:hypothetical protein
MSGARGSGSGQGGPPPAGIRGPYRGARGDTSLKVGRCLTFWKAAQV